jgi:hypothetical protein
MRCCKVSTKRSSTPALQQLTRGHSWWLPARAEASHVVQLMLIVTCFRTVMQPWMLVIMACTILTTLTWHIHHVRHTVYLLHGTQHHETYQR